MQIENIKTEKELKNYIKGLNFEEILKDERICNIIDILKNQNINTILKKEKKLHSYAGYFSDNMTITIVMQDTIFDLLSQYKRKAETFGEIYLDNTIVHFKNDSDAIVYTIVYTLLHEYKHYLQLINGELANIDKSFNDDITSPNYGYQDENTKKVDEDAEDFALVNAYQIMIKNNYENIIKEQIDIDSMKTILADYLGEIAGLTKEDEAEFDKLLESCPEGFALIDDEDLPDEFKTNK